MQYEALEFECVDGIHDKFYRIIRYGGTLVIRFGKRGSEGQRICQQHSVRIATDKFAEIAFQMTQQKNYEEVRSDVTLNAPNFADQYHPSTDELEDHYLLNWRNQASPIALPDQVYHERASWSIIVGVLGLSKVNQERRFVLEDLTRVPHAIDEVRDMILAPTLQKFSTSIQVTPLIQTSPQHSLDLLTRVLNLYYPGHPGRTELFAAATTLANAS